MLISEDLCGRGPCPKYVGAVVESYRIRDTALDRYVRKVRRKHAAASEVLSTVPLDLKSQPRLSVPFTFHL